MFLIISRVQDDISIWVGHSKDIALVIVLLIKDDALVSIAVMKKRFYYWRFFVHFYSYYKLVFGYNYCRYLKHFITIAFYNSGDSPIVNDFTALIFSIS